MATADITSTPMVFDQQTEPRFFVRAMCDIQAPKHMIKAGDDVLIDPHVTPTTDQVVLVGNRLEPWRGQPYVLGVAVQISRAV